MGKNTLTLIFFIWELGDLRNWPIQTLELTNAPPCQASATRRRLQLVAQLAVGQRAESILLASAHRPHTEVCRLPNNRAHERFLNSACSLRDT